MFNFITYIKKSFVRMTKIFTWVFLPFTEYSSSHSRPVNAAVTSTGVTHFASAKTID